MGVATSIEIMVWTTAINWKE